MTDLEDARFYDGSPVKVCRTNFKNNAEYGYFIFVVVFFFVMPFGLLAFIYFKIIRKLMCDGLEDLLEDRQQCQQALARKQVVNMLIVIVVVFFVSHFPIRVVTIWLIFCPTQHQMDMGLEVFLNLISWARILAYINSAANPIIYSLTSTKFKAAFRRFLHLGPYSIKRRYNEAENLRIRRQFLAKQLKARQRSVILLTANRQLVKLDNDQNNSKNIMDTEV